MPESPPVYVIAARKQEHELRFQIDRYLKENTLPLSRPGFSLEHLYYPYWKITAFRLKITRGETTTGLINDELSDDGWGFRSLAGIEIGSDASSGSLSRIDDDSVRRVTLAPYVTTQAAGPPVEGIPFSIGLRSEYIRVVPWSAERAAETDHYVPAAVSWEEACAGLSKTAATKARLEVGCGGTLQWEIFHPTGVLIYFPYVMAVADAGSERYRFVLDGLTGQVVHMAQEKNELPILHEIRPPQGLGHLKVVFHRCLSCGIDLPATQSWVYLCHNCGSVISLEKDELLRGGLAVAAASGNPADSLFPFWRLQATPDIVRTVTRTAAGMPVGDSLMIPAFALANFDALRRLTQKMTAIAPQLSWSPLDREVSYLLPAAVSLSHARSLAEIVVYCERAAEQSTHHAAAEPFPPHEARLVYAPFHSEAYFMIDSVLSAVTFEKGLLNTRAL